MLFRSSRIIVIHITRAFVGVVPVVESWSCDEPLQGTEAPAQVGMYKEAPDRTQQKNDDWDQTRGSADGSGETQYIERDQTAEAGEHHV